MQLKPIEKLQLENLQLKLQMQQQSVETLRAQLLSAVTGIIKSHRADPKTHVIDMRTGTIVADESRKKTAAESAQPSTEAKGDAA
jgi:hypothetical protein